MSEKKLFFKSALLVLVANAVSLAFAFFSRPLIARFLGPSEYGVFALILGTAAVIPAFTLLALNNGVLFFVSKQGEDKRKVGAVIGSSIASLAFFSLVLFVPSFFLVQWFVPALGFWGFISASILAFVISLFYILQSTQQGLEDFKNYSVSTASSTAVAAVLAVVAALLFVSAFASSLLRAFAVLVVVAIGFWKFKCKLSFDWKILKELYVFSFPIAAAAFVGTFIAVADRYVLAAYQSTAQVGVYDVASSLTTAVLPFIVVISNVMAPKVIKTPGRVKDFFKAVSTANVVFLTGFSIALFYLSEIVVSILLGESYVDGTSQVIRILCLSLPLIGLYSLSTVVTTSMNKTKVTGFLGMLLVVLTIALNVLLVPSLGAPGSAYANLATYSVLALVCLFYLVKSFKVELNHYFQQLLLFAFFVLAYPLFSSGFVLKLVGLVLFAFATLLLNKKFVTEVFELISEKIVIRK